MPVHRGGHARLHTRFRHHLDSDHQTIVAGKLKRADLRLQFEGLVQCWHKRVHHRNPSGGFTARKRDMWHHRPQVQELGQPEIRPDAILHSGKVRTTNFGIR